MPTLVRPEMDTRCSTLIRDGSRAFIRDGDRTLVRNGLRVLVGYGHRTLVRDGHRTSVRDGHRTLVGYGHRTLVRDGFSTLARVGQRTLDAGRCKETVETYHIVRQRDIPPQLRRAPKFLLAAFLVLPVVDIVNTLVSFTSDRKAPHTLKLLPTVCSSMAVSENTSSLSEVPETCRKMAAVTQQMVP